MREPINEAIQACLANGRRILNDDASFSEFNDPPATAYFLRAPCVQKISRT
jgi:hypothetical protein